IAHFPLAAGELLLAGAVSCDRVEVRESVGLGDIPHAPVLIVPARALIARAPDPRAVARRLEGRDMAARIDGFQQASLVVAAKGVHEAACPGIIPTEELESA